MEGVSDEAIQKILEKANSMRKESTATSGSGDVSISGSTSKKRPVPSYDEDPTSKKSSSKKPASEEKLNVTVPPKLKEEISAFVVAYLSKYKDEILAAPSYDFKSLARKVKCNFVDKYIFV